jgi:molybdenum cofactor cytidylyltransferase
MTRSSNFGDYPVHDAIGVMLAHRLNIAATGLRLKKGHPLTADDIAHLQAAGVTHISGVRLGPHDIAENPAAQSIARLLGGPNTAIRPANGGRCNLHATCAGLLVLQARPIIEANQISEEIAIGTLPPWTTVRPGQVIATVKIIPCSVTQAQLAHCAERLNTPPMHVAPFQPRRAALIITELPSQRETRQETIVQVTRQRLEALGSRLALELHCPHDTPAIARALTAATAAGCELILINGAAGTKDRRDIVPAAIVAAGGHIERFGLPVEPGNMLLQARLAHAPVLILPGCARSRRLNGLDWILQRILAGLPPNHEEYAAMGIGGLIRNLPGHYPEAPPDAPDDDVHDTHDAPNPAPPPTTPAPRITALILAAGRSSRMNTGTHPTHKLLATVDGIPLIQRAVNTALASKAASVMVVTGHQAEAIAPLIAHPRVERIHNPDYSTGLASSLRAGLAALPDHCDGVLILLADMPHLHAGHLDALIDAHIHSHRITVPMHDGRRGNPLLWPRAYFAELQTLQGDQGARQLLACHSDDITLVDFADPAIFIDIDTPEDLAACNGHLPT